MLIAFVKAESAPSNLIELLDIINAVEDCAWLIASMCGTVFSTMFAMRSKRPSPRCCIVIATASVAVTAGAESSRSASAFAF
jgi:hypothetical protein